jgi:hypothetical protein
MAERAQRKPIYLQLTEWEGERLRIKAQTLQMTLRELIVKAVDAYAPTTETNRLDSIQAQIYALSVRIDALEVSTRSIRDSVTSVGKTALKRIDSAESELHRRIDRLDPSSKLHEPTQTPSYIKKPGQ